MLFVPSLRWFSGSLLNKLLVSVGFADKGPIFNMNMKTISLNHLFYASSVSMSYSRNSSLSVWSHHLQLLPRLGWARPALVVKMSGKHENILCSEKYFLFQHSSAAAEDLLRSEIVFRLRENRTKIHSTIWTLWTKWRVKTEGEVDNWIVLQ